MTYPCDELGPYAYDPNVHVLWVPTVTGIGDVEAPTDTELTAGTELNDPYNLTDIIGWEVETNVIDKMVYGPIITQLAGVQRVADMQLIFAADRVATPGADVRRLIARDDSGFIVLLPSGSFTDHPLAPMNVYPVDVAQVSQMHGLRQDASTVRVTFVLTGPVGESVFAEITP